MSISLSTGFIGLSQNVNPARAWLLPNSVYGLNATGGWALVDGKIVPYDDEAGRTGRRNSTALYLTNGIWREAPIDGTRRGDNGDQLGASATNVCNNYNANPVDTSGVVEEVAANPGISIVSDTAELAEAGLSGAVSAVLKIDNSLNAGSCQYQIGGSTGNTNDVSISAFARVEAGSGDIGLKAVAVQAIPSAKYTRVVREGLTPDASNRTFQVRAAANSVIYICLNQLEEGSKATSPIIVAGSSATRAADTLVATQGSGDELVTNGDFADGITGWDALSDASLSAAGGQLTVTTTGPDTQSEAAQAVSTEVGATYFFEATKVSQDHDSAWGVSTSEFGARDLLSVTSGATGSQSGTFVATTTTTYVQLWSQDGGSGTGGQAVYDNVSITKVAVIQD